jgi:hypothetical protein
LDCADVIGCQWDSVLGKLEDDVAVHLVNALGHTR